MCLIIGALAFATVSAEPAAAARYGPIPVDGESLHPAGTQLGDGFTVADGTALVGGVFPTPTIRFVDRTSVVDRGWRAVLLVAGEPREVMKRYRKQAAAVGMELHSRATLCGFGPSDPRIYECFATGVLAAPGDPRAISFLLMRGQSDFGPVSHLNIVYSDPDVPTRPPYDVALETTLTPNAPPGPAAPAVPTIWAPIAGPGRLLFSDLAASNAVVAPVRVTRGSTAAVPVGPAASGLYGPVSSALFANSYDWMAVLRVTGDPQAVVRAYRRELRSNTGTYGTLGPIRTEHPTADTTVFLFGAESIGNSNHYLQIVQRKSGNWMLVSAHNQT